MLSTMKYGLLNALLMISMNGNNCVVMKQSGLSKQLSVIAVKHVE